MKAYKRDICGNLYEGYKRDEKYNFDDCNTDRLLDGVIDISANGYILDICKPCYKSIVEFINDKVRHTK